MNLSLSLLIFALSLIESSFSFTSSAPPRSTFHPYHPIVPMDQQPPRQPRPATTSQIQNMTSFADANQTRTTSAAPASSTPASHRGSGDPCGPENTQTDFESTIDTCGQINTTYTHAPSIYGVQCLNANPSWRQSINLTSCASNIASICAAMLKGTVAASQWNWSNGGPNCTMGVWFNPLPAAQPTREYTRCRSDIFDLMFDTCSEVQGAPFNVAAVNLKTLPDQSGSGSQVDVGYPSYIMVPQTFDDTDDNDGEYQEGED